MISKKSFIKLVKDDARKRSWLWLLSVLIFCLVLPGVALDSVQSRLELDSSAVLKDYYLNMISHSERNYFLLGTVFLAVVSALSGMSYIHSRSRLDFYHSLPVKRETWLKLQYVSGFLIFMVPAFLNVVVELIIGMVYQAVDGTTILAALETYGIYLLIYLFSYSLCVMAMLVTGKLLLSILAIPALFCFTALGFSIFRMFKSAFFRTYYALENTSEFLKYPSPWTLITELVRHWGDYVRGGMQDGFPKGCFFLMAVFTVVLIALNRWLYRVRKTEAAGSAIVFGKAANLIEVIVVVTASLGAGVYLKTFSYTQSDLWFFGGMVLGIVVFTALIDFIYSMDIRSVLKKPILTLVITVLVFGTALTFRLDLLGFNTYLPDEKKISSMSVENYALTNVSSQMMTYSFTESSSTSGNGSLETLNSYQMTEFEPIYAMAENGRENARSGNEETEGKIYVNICYNLTNGRSVYRTYLVDEEVYEENAEKLYEKQGFIKAMYPIFSRNNTLIEAIAANGVDNSSGYTAFRSEEEKQYFIKTYQEELLTITYEELTSSEMLGTLSISYEESVSPDGSYISVEDSGYPVLKRFVKTLALLEDMGVEFTTQLNPDEVQEIEVWPVGGETSINLLAVEAGQADLITEAEKRELLEMLTYQYCVGNTFGNKSYMITAYGSNGLYLQSFHVPEEELPVSIRNVLAEYE